MKRTRCAPFLAAVLVAALAVNVQLGLADDESSEDATSPNPACVCNKIYAPVCGVDGKTYGNDCMANCAGVTEDCKGECPCGTGPIACTEEYAPVCGIDGQTYSNKCHAGSTPIECQGECPCNSQGCACHFDYNPVCGVNGKTYANSCGADCERVRVECQGECPCNSVDPCQNCKLCLAVDYADRPGGLKCSECNPGFRLNHLGYCDGCVCTADYNPVCGSDGKTYGNSCGASCQHVDVACDGECPCRKPPQKPGNCPTSTGFGICIHGCSSDTDCSGKKKCCHNGCGTTCEDPVGGSAGCPPGKPMVYCFVNPCDVTPCPAFPNAKCVADYCGGCNAIFFKGKREVTRWCNI